MVTVYWNEEVKRESAAAHMRSDVAMNSGMEGRDDLEAEVSPIDHPRLYTMQGQVLHRSKMLQTSKSFFSQLCVLSLIRSKDYSDGIASNCI